MKEELVKKLKEIAGNTWVISERESILDYLIDETAPTVRPEPAQDVILVKPDSTHEVSSIMKLANEEKILVFPRGGGTGLVAGSIPTEDGILLSLERMNRIVEVDRENLMITAEAGVTLLSLKETVDESGLSFPLHPGDESAQLGGLVSCNAGGARAVKHGVMRNYVKGVEVVLPTGEILSLRGKLLKDVAGYDLMHLLIGSQGTLGIITKIILRLYPKLKETTTLIIPYDDRYDALRTVPNILLEGITPLAIEFSERGLMVKSAARIGKTWPIKEGTVSLIIILSGKNREEVYAEADRIDKIAKRHKAIDTLVIQNKRKQDDILNIRSKIYFVLKPYTMDITDVAVPPAKIAEFMSEVDKIAEKFDTHLPVFGHVGDGNLHTHILMEKDGGVKREDLRRVKKAIYDKCTRMGGTITAEHGLGKIRIKDFERYTDVKILEIMKRIKEAFDPNNVLNPGTVIPQART